MSSPVETGDSLLLQCSQLQTCKPTQLVTHPLQQLLTQCSIYASSFLITARPNFSFCTEKYVALHSKPPKKWLLDTLPADVYQMVFYKILLLSCKRKIYSLLKEALKKILKGLHDATPLSSPPVFINLGLDISLKYNLE